MRWVLCAAVWLIANAAGLLVASQTKWGPVVVELSARHGVHAGDVVAVLLGLVIASVVTVAVWVTAPVRPDTNVVVAWVLVAAVWEVCLVSSLFVAASTDYGPVVVRLWQGKPVRLGDVVVVLAGIAVATGITAVVWSALPPTRPSTATTATKWEHLPPPPTSPPSRRPG